MYPSNTHPQPAVGMSKRPRRKRGRADEEGEGEEEGATLAIKRSTASGDVVWEWEGDGGRWSPFSPAHSRALVDSLSKGDKDCTLQVAPGVSLLVRFAAMTQMNVGTGWQRNVRCLPKVASTTTTSNLWEFQDPLEGWCGYGTAGQLLLEACRLCGVGGVGVEVGGRECEVDLVARLHSDKGSGHKYPVRCTDLRSIPAWRWEDEHGTWHDYPPNLSRWLESAYGGGGGGGGGGVKLSFTAEGRKYTVDLGKLEQKNDSTGVIRRVVRAGGPSPAAMAITSAAAMATTSAASSTEPGPSSTVRRSTRTASSASIKPGPVSTEPEPSSTRRQTTRKTSQTSSADSKPGAASADSGAAKPSTSAEPSSPSHSSPPAALGQLSLGQVPVDGSCSQKVGKAHVYCENGEHWDAMLNQTNLRNNNNKFYLLQLLEDDKGHGYCVWFRWGRVGKTGQHMLIECGSDLDQAKQEFSDKFYAKTLNSWTERSPFTKHAGKYDLLAMDYEPKEEVDGEGDDETDAVEKKPPPECTLDHRLRSLIELISNVQAMEEAVMAMKYDTEKAPLGKLTTDQIKSGYTALKRIEDCLNRDDYGQMLVQACDDFYTRVPHSFGMRRPPIIRTEEAIKEKMALLEALGDIQIALKVLGDRTAADQHSVDRHYLSLKCTLTPFNPHDAVFQMVVRYVVQTHARSHIQYRSEVVQVFAVEREGEKEAFRDLGNRRLLWHGSRLTNWVGILCQGLRIAPPEAPVTGYMFGKGVYFADMCSKSTNYCFATRRKDEGLALLCDVALGQTQDLVAADYSADKLPGSKHSTCGLGKVAPDPAQSEMLPDGCVVPLGTAVDTGVSNPRGYTLNYNEYVVYDTRQVKMRFLVRLKFHFK